MAVKVPPLLHKMSASAQKAWYKKHGMEMPAKEKSAATAGKMKAPEPKKVEPAAVSNKPKTAREISMERQKAYYAKGGRQPIGAGGSGGHSSMAGVGQSSAKEIIKGIRAGVNPKSRGIGEEASPMIKPPTNRFDKKSDAFAHAEKHGGKVYKQTYTDSKGQQTVSYSVKKEEVELDEASKAEAEKALGGPVKTRTGNEPKGKLPLGFRRARNLARQAMRGGVSAIHRSMEKTMQKENVTESTTELSEVNEMSYGKKLAKAIMAKQSKHPIAQQMGEEVIVEQDDAMEKKEMAQTQLHFIGYAAKEILEFIDMGGEIEEWYQNKLSKVQSEVESLHSYIEGEKRRTGMVEETEQVDEKIDLEKAKMGDVIKDFQKSDAPQFKGKSMEKRREMAIAAKLGAERGMKEEAEPVAEKYMGFKAVMAAAKKGGARDPAAVAAAIGRKKYGKEKFQAMAAAGKRAANEEAALDEADLKSKPVLHKGKEIGETGIDAEASPGVGKWYAKHHKSGMNTAGFDSRKEAESEVRAAHGLDEEAEGSAPTTPKEKELAKHHGDPNKITYGDVIKARLKSAAAKKMGK
jgi:hypothetical protein